MNTKPTYVYSIGRHAEQPDMSGRPTYTLLTNTLYDNVENARLEALRLPRLRGERPLVLRRKAGARADVKPFDWSEVAPAHTPDEILESLERLANDASHSEWRTDIIPSRSPDDRPRIGIVQEGDRGAGEKVVAIADEQADANYLAAVHPSLVLELIAEVRTARDNERQSRHRIQELEDYIDYIEGRKVPEKLRKPFAIPTDGGEGNPSEPDRNLPHILVQSE